MQRAISEEDWRLVEAWVWQEHNDSIADKCQSNVEQWYGDWFENHFEKHWARRWRKQWGDEEWVLNKHGSIYHRKSGHFVEHVVRILIVDWRNIVARLVWMSPPFSAYEQVEQWEVLNRHIASESNFVSNQYFPVDSKVQQFNNEMKSRTIHSPTHVVHAMQQWFAWLMGD